MSYPYHVQLARSDHEFGQLGEWFDFDANGMFVSKMVFPHPVPKTTIFRPVSTDGEVDTSEAVHGDISFDAVDGTITVVIPDNSDFSAEDFRSFRNQFHGKRVILKTSDDDIGEYLRVGRIYISDDDFRKCLRTFVISMRANPYRWAVEDTITDLPQNIKIGTPSFGKNANYGYPSSSYKTETITTESDGAQYLGKTSTASYDAMWTVLTVAPFHQAANLVGFLQTQTASKSFADFKIYRSRTLAKWGDGTPPPDDAELIADFHFRRVATYETYYTSSGRPQRRYTPPRRDFFVPLYEDVNTYLYIFYTDDKESGVLFYLKGCNVFTPASDPAVVKIGRNLTIPRITTDADCQITLENKVYKISAVTDQLMFDFPLKQGTNYAAAYFNEEGHHAYLRWRDGWL